MSAVLENTTDSPLHAMQMIASLLHNNAGLLGEIGHVNLHNETQAPLLVSAWLRSVKNIESHTDALAMIRIFSGVDWDLQQLPANFKQQAKDIGYILIAHDSHNNVPDSLEQDDLAYSHDNNATHRECLKDIVTHVQMHPNWWGAQVAAYAQNNEGNALLNWLVFAESALAQEKPANDAANDDPTEACDVHLALNFIVNEIMDEKITWFIDAPAMINASRKTILNDARHAVLWVSEDNSDEYPSQDGPKP